MISRKIEFMCKYQIYCIIEMIILHEVVIEIYYPITI